MVPQLDDDDTMPTGNTGVIAELTAAATTSRLGVSEWGNATSPGVRRRLNEDAWDHRGAAFAVADGMGGRGGGALAARTAVERFLARLAAAGEHPDWRGIVEAVNVDVIRAGRERDIDRLGTTLLAAIADGPVVTIVHVGDSRAYRLSSSGGSARLDVLTRDHNVRSELLAAGLDLGEYGERGVALHGLTSFIGLEHALRVDVLAVAVRAGDRLLLCTDGIHRQVDDDQLRAALTDSTCQAAAERLVALADDAGGRDNATAVVLGIGGI